MSLWGLLPLLLDEKRKSATFLSRAIITGDQGTFERKYKLYKTQHLEKELKSDFGDNLVKCIVQNCNVCTSGLSCFLLTLIILSF